MLKKLKISLIIIMIMALSYFIAAADELEDAMLQFDETYQKQLEIALDVKQWEKFSDRLNDEAVEQNLLEKLKNMPHDDAVLSNRWKKYFIPVLYEKLSDKITKKNQQWSKDYLDLVKNFNLAQINLQSFQETADSLNNALDTYLTLHKRLLSVEEVYLQNLKGVDTTFLVLGISQWDTHTQKSNECFNTIVKGGKAFVRQEFENTALIFSHTSMEEFRIKKDIIRSYSGGQIEEYETDPLLFQDETTMIAVQQYRVFPEFPKIGSSKMPDIEIPDDEKSVPSGNYYLPLKTDNTSNSFQADIFLKQLSNIIDDAKNFLGYSKESIADNLFDKIKHLLNKVQKKNKISLDQIINFNTQYNSDIEPIEDEINQTGRKISNDLNKLIKKIVNIDPKAEISSLTRDITNFLKSSEPEESYNFKDSIKNRLNKIKKTLFFEHRDQAEHQLTEKIQKRKMLIFTIQSEFVPGGALAGSIPPKILTEALKRLKIRKERLVSYEFSIVEDRVLVNHQAAQYYDNGTVVRYFMPVPVLSFQKSIESGGTVAKMSILLALEIEYVKREENNLQSYRSEKDFINRTFHDKENNLIWLIGNEEDCLTYNEIEDILPNDFNIPTIKQLNLLNLFLNKDTSKALYQKYKYLFQSRTELWTAKFKKYTKKRATFQMSSEIIEYHNPDSYCGLAVAVKKVP
ncbi:conserved hypothetical protein [Candidatus Magnetomoraceae bacterium gMMP-15]